MNSRLCSLITFVLAAGIAVSACSKGSEGEVLAKVNRATITASDFKKQLEDLAPQMQQAVASDPKARKEFLEDLIGIELVLQEARRQGLDKDAEFKKRQEALKQELERRVQDEARNDLFNSLLKKELGEKMGKVEPPSDKDVRAYFDQNRDRINKGAGKSVAFKEIEQQLKMRMMQEKRRELYLDYAKTLKAKAKISVNDKALDSSMADLAKSADLSGLNVTTVPAPGKTAGK